MPPILKTRQSGDFAAFRCIGAACEDTCCSDWGVPIDRKTYEKYQACSDSLMQPLLNRFVTISPSKGKDEDFARIALIDNRCPFLAEGLCSIQQRLGESYLSNACATYPRSVVIINGTEERSLHLSCPEAARLVLLNQGPHEWTEQTVEADEVPGAGSDDKVTAQGFPILDSLGANRAGTSYPCFEEVRELFLEVLRAVGKPRWQRLAILARLSDELNAILEGGNRAADQADATAQFVQRSRSALRTGALMVDRTSHPNPLIQIEAVLELIVARIGSDFTTRRFLECYREFMQGLRWGSESTMEEIDSRCTAARLRNYAPFMNRHAYLLDNFLINYCIRTLFPYGHREINHKFAITYVENAVRRQYLLLAVHYAAVQTVLIGMAAFHGAAFGTEHVVRLVQSYAKAFLHSESYPEKALQILSSHGIGCLASDAVVLFQE